MSACIYYHPEAYTTSGPKLMGRNAAGESFLRGFLTHSKTPEFWVQAQSLAHARHFAATVTSLNRTEPVRAVEKGNIGALAQVGAVYHPGPGIAAHAWERTHFGDGAWSLCGITHTTSSAAAMDLLVELITAPVQAWDAVICTSTSVKDNVMRVLQAQVDYLASRLGITRTVLPQLPVIPLGIHTRDFAFTEQDRATARNQIGADNDALVVLFTGRLSFHAKAHPLAMYLGLEQAAIATGKRIILVECGWHANDSIERAYADAAHAACPSVRVVTLDGRTPHDRATAWACADIFCSLSDNIQETFGIVPIEAMAAGLPVVVSDWDGYKDTVRDGIDGFRIPTLMPGAGLGNDLALRHALGVDTYDMYCGHSCSLIAVDVEATAKAFEQLFSSPELRARMGAAGRERARSLYDWEVIIPQYEVLWKQLGDIRCSVSGQITRPSHPWPARMDPFHSFAAYPSATLAPETRLVANGIDAAQRLATWRGLAMVDFAKAVLPTPDECAQVLRAAAGSARPAAELVAGIPSARRPHVFRALTWLVKLGILRKCA